MLYGSDKFSGNTNKFKPRCCWKFRSILMKILAIQNRATKFTCIIWYARFSLQPSTHTYAANTLVERVTFHLICQPQILRVRMCGCGRAPSTQITHTHAQAHAYTKERVRRAKVSHKTFSNEHACFHLTTCPCFISLFILLHGFFRPHKKWKRKWNPG